MLSCNETPHFKEPSRPEEGFDRLQDDARVAVQETQNRGDQKDDVSAEDDLLDEQKILKKVDHFFES